MLVKIMVKTKKHPQPDSTGSQFGDVMCLWPLNKDHGRKVFNTYMAVVMNLNIPCGGAFDDQPPPCADCKFNDPESCDKSRLERGVWSAGDVLNPPRLLKKQQYRIDISSLVSAETLALLQKTEKAEEEKASVLQNALNNPQQSSVIIDKEAEK